MGASLKSTRLTRAPFLTSLHTKTHTHTNTRWNSSAGSRFETHNPGLFFFCYNILCLTSFPTFSLFPPPHSPPIWNYHLFSELSASQVSAAMCRTHHKQRGPVETGWVLVWAMWWVSEWGYFLISHNAFRMPDLIPFYNTFNTLCTWLIYSYNIIDECRIKIWLFLHYPSIFNYLWLDLHLFASTLTAFTEKNQTTAFTSIWKVSCFAEIDVSGILLVLRGFNNLWPSPLLVLKDDKKSSKDWLFQ